MRSDSSLFNLRTPSGLPDMPTPGTTVPGGDDPARPSTARPGTARPGTGQQPATEGGAPARKVRRASVGSRSTSVVRASWDPKRASVNMGEKGLRFAREPEVIRINLQMRHLDPALVSPGETGRLRSKSTRRTGRIDGRFDLDANIEGYRGSPEQLNKLEVAKLRIAQDNRKKIPRFEKKVDSDGRKNWVLTTVTVVDRKTGLETTAPVKSGHERTNESWARKEQQIARATTRVAKLPVVKKLRRTRGQSFSKPTASNRQATANNSSQTYSNAGWAGGFTTRPADGVTYSATESNTPTGEIGSLLILAPVALDTWGTHVSTAKGKAALRAVRDQVALNFHGWKRFVDGSADPRDRAAFNAFEVAITQDPFYNPAARDADKRADAAFNRDGVVQPVGAVVNVGAVGMMFAGAPGASLLAAPVAGFTAKYDIQQGRSEASFQLKNYRARKDNIARFADDFYTLDNPRQRCVIGGYLRAQEKARDLAKHEYHFGVSRKLKGYANSVMGTVGNLGLGAVTLLAATGAVITVVSWPVVVGVLTAAVALPTAAYYTGNAAKFGIRRASAHAIKRAQRDVAMALRQYTSATMSRMIRSLGAGDYSLEVTVMSYRGDFKPSDRKRFASMHLATIDLMRKGHFALHLLAQDVERYLDTGNDEHLEFAAGMLEKAGMNSIQMALLLEDASAIAPGRQRTSMIKARIAPALGVSFTTTGGLEPLPHVSFYMERVFAAVPVLTLMASDLVERLRIRATKAQLQDLKGLLSGIEEALGELGKLKTLDEIKNASALAPSHEHQREYLRCFGKLLASLKTFHARAADLLAPGSRALDENADTYFLYSVLEALSHTVDRTFVQEFLEVMAPFDKFIREELQGDPDVGTVLCCDLYRLMSRNPAIMERLWGAGDCEAFAQGDWETMYDPERAAPMGGDRDAAVVTDGGLAVDRQGRQAPMGWLLTGPFAIALIQQTRDNGNSIATGGMIQHAIEIWATPPGGPAHLKQHSGQNLCSLHCLNMLVHDVTGRWDYMIPDQAAHAAAFRHTHGVADIALNGSSFGELLTWTLDDPEFGAHALLRHAFRSCSVVGDADDPGATPGYRLNDGSGISVSADLATANSIGLTFNMRMEQRRRGEGANPGNQGVKFDTITHSVVIRRAPPGHDAPFLMYDPMLSEPVPVTPANGSTDMRDAIREVMQRHGTPGDNAHEVCLPASRDKQPAYDLPASLPNMRSVGPGARLPAQVTPAQAPVVLPPAEEGPPPPNYTPEPPPVDPDLISAQESLADIRRSRRLQRASLFSMVSLDSLSEQDRQPLSPSRGMVRSPQISVVNRSPQTSSSEKSDAD